MEILHLIPNLGIGGAQTMMFELYHSIKTYYPQYKQRIVYLTNMRIDKNFVSSYNVECELSKNNNWLLNKIKKRKSVIIYHKLASCSFGLLDLIKRKTNAKIIVINHTFYKSSSWTKFKNIDIIISVSEHMYNNVCGWYPKIKHTWIHNSVSMSRYEKIGPRGISKKGILLTGRVNRICTWKHPKDWEKWCRDVKLPSPMLHEYIGSKVGTNNRKNRATVSKGRNSVIMLGGISNFEEKVSIMKDWDVFLYETNKHEGISMAILESLACGVPVVCSNHLGNTEIIKEGVNGYIFNNRDEARNILKSLIKNPDKLKELKRTTKEHFKENLDSKHMATKYISVIEKMTGKKVKQIEQIKEVEKEEVKIKIKSNEKFSILTSSFNKAKYLNDWADSILQQKYRPLEVVLVNDLSTDNTSQVLEGIENNFKVNDIEFKLINNSKQLYCGSSYKSSIQHATGSYFGVVDADDMLAEGAVSYIMDLYKKHPDIAWIYTQFLWCDENMVKRKRGFHRSPGKNRSLLDMGDKGIHGIGTGWRTFNHKIEKPLKLFGKDMKCAVDKNMGYRLEEAGFGMFTNKICYKHRGHPIGSKDSVSSTKDAMRMWKRVIEKTHNRRKKYKKIIYPIIECKNE